MEKLLRRILLFLLFTVVIINTSIFRSNWKYPVSAEDPYETNSRDYFAQKETANYFGHSTNKKSMNISSVLLDFDLKDRACDQVTKSEARDSVITYKTYQHFKLRFPNHQEVFDAYIMNFYFDDRFDQKPIWFNEEHDQMVRKKGRGFKYYVRTVASILGPDFDNRSKFLEFHRDVDRTAQYGYFWYDGYENPIVMPCGCQDSAHLSWKVNGSNYYQYLINCPVPEIDLLPAELSISSQRCSFLTTFKYITYPEIAYQHEGMNYPTDYKRVTADRQDEPEKEYMEDYKLATQTIGLCIQPLFGTLGDADVTYLTSWMEFLKVFGISEVSIANASLVLQGDMIKKAFQYYEQSGYLTLQQFPIIHPYVNNKHDEQAGSLAVKQMAISDCFLRKIKKYWYVLIHDFDEIFVPNYHTTYQEYLFEYMYKTNISAQKADCLATRSAYFYRNLTQLHTNNQPHWVPPLKYLTRFEPEPFGIPGQGGVGMVKSFSKMSTLVAAGCHLCRQTQDKFKIPHQFFLPPDGLLIHHFRKSCDSVHGNDLRCLGKTDKDGRSDRLIYDERIARFASKVVPSVRRVLEEIGYFHGTER